MREPNRPSTPFRDSPEQPPRPLTAAEVNAEKDEKPRCDLVSPHLVLAAGRGLGRGARKHGTPGGLGTYRVKGNRQSLVSEHVASLERHIADLKAGKLYVPDTPGYYTIDAMASQMSILCDLFFDPVQEPTGDELRWPWPHLNRDGVRVVEPDQRLPCDGCGKPCFLPGSEIRTCFECRKSVGAAFAAGAVEGENPRRSG